MMRWPSGCAAGSSLGLAPVAISTAVAPMVYAAPACGVTMTWCKCPSVSAPNVARPATRSTPALVSFAAMSADWAWARRLTRSFTAAPSSATASGVASRTPRLEPWRKAVTTSEDAMNVFDGTQSDSTQAPPAPDASTSVTSAPAGWRQARPRSRRGRPR